MPNNDDVPAIIQWLVKTGIDGLGVLPSAQKVAKNHLDSSNDDQEKAINSIIRWRTTHAASTGFITGLGGLVTLPVTIPASLATSYSLGANTAAAIAHIRGYNIKSNQVQTFILPSLLGDSGKETLKGAGIQIGKKITQEFIKKIPARSLRNINKRIGFRLVTKAGEKGVVNLTKFVPVVGGVIGSGVDGTFVYSCGQTAKVIFSK